MGLRGHARSLRPVEIASGESIQCLDVCTTYGRVLTKSRFSCRGLERDEGRENLVFISSQQHLSTQIVLVSKEETLAVIPTTT